MTTERTIAVVGLGLVGGSLVKALRGAWRGRVRLIGIEPSAETRRRVELDGVVDLLLDAPASLDDCGLVVICTPLAAALALLEPLSHAMRDGAVLTDVAGVKSKVIEAARTSVRPGVSFVGAHPMFGGPQGGYAASDGASWNGGTVALITDAADAHALDLVESTYASLGARIVRCTADAHDEAMAVVSHLPYLLARTLAEETRDASDLARRLAGRGFADMTRLASFSDEVQGEVARGNPRLSAAVQRFVARLSAATS